MYYPDDLNPFHSSSIQEKSLRLQKSYLDNYTLPDEFPFSSSTVSVKNKIVSMHPLQIDNLPDVLYSPQVSSVLSSRTMDSSFLIDDLPDSLLFHQLSRHVSSSQKSACCDECELPGQLSCGTSASEMKNHGVQPAFTKIRKPSTGLHYHSDFNVYDPNFPLLSSPSSFVSRQPRAVAKLGEFPDDLPFFYFPPAVQKVLSQEKSKRIQAGLEFSTPNQHFISGNQTISSLGFIHGKGYAQTPQLVYPIAELFDDAAFQTGAFYGKSISMFETNSSGNVCSAYLISGRNIVTAQHCTSFAQQTIHPIFGLYGPLNSHILGHRESVFHARNRLIDLGIPQRDVDNVIGKQYIFNRFAVRTVNRMLQLFSCNQKQVIQYPDVALFECDKNQLRYELPLHGPQQVGIAPGFIYDFLPLKTVPTTTTLQQLQNLYNKQKDVYGLHMNDKNRQQISDKIRMENFEILLSPGNILDLTQWTLTKDQSFTARTSVFTLPGSSGSPLLGHKENEAFGTLSYALPSSFVPNISSPTNIVSGYDFNPDAKFWSSEFPKILSNFNAFPSPQNDITSEWFMGNGGEILQNLTCPPGHAAAGVIGSSISSKTNLQERDTSFDRLGNFGLICLPFTSIENYDFALARVIAGGSIDLTILTEHGSSSRSANMIPFNRYINEYLTSGGTHDRVQGAKKEPGRPSPIGSIGYQQHFSMCPPGFFLNGVWITSNQIDGQEQIEGIYLLKCKHGETGKTHFQPIRLPIGASFPLSSSVHREFNVLDCPPEHVISGLNIKSGKFTNAIQFRCKKVWGER